jgi:cell division topological specificity factor
MAWGALVQRFFGTKGSKDEAKGRLQIVLAYDRLGLSADQMEALRKDIMETISRHVAIDTDRVKVEFWHGHHPPAVMIEAPVRSKRSSGEEAKPAEEPKQDAEPEEKQEVKETLKQVANGKPKQSVS